MIFIVGSNSSALRGCKIYKRRTFTKWVRQLGLKLLVETKARSIHVSQPKHRG